MSRRSLIVRLAGAVIGVVAIAFAAASIERSVEPGGSGGGGGDGEGAGGPTAPPESPMFDSFDPGGLPWFLEVLGAIVLVFLAVTFVWYVIVHRREVVKFLAAFVLLAVLGLALFHLVQLLGLGASEVVPPEQPVPPEEGGGEPGSGEGTANPFPMGTLLSVLVALAVVFLGALALTRGDDGADEPLESEPESDEQSGEAAALGAAAGRAAERIEHADEGDLDNEVYRAWRNMTALLDVSRPETSTPGEFAEAAVAAGLAREHVEELTGLFEAVRYGHAETTREMESRAVTVLRRIESEYASIAEGEVDSVDGSKGGDRW